MAVNASIKNLAFLLLAFLVPLVLFQITATDSLLFDDAAEFALVIKLGSIAHPPGTPSYIFTGMVVLKLFSIFGMSVIESLTLFSSLSVATASLFVYLTYLTIARNLYSLDNAKTLLVCSLSAIAFATASTTWAWSNTVEVYAFQVLTLAVALYGLVAFHFSGARKFIFIAATGIAAGLSNHHVTMIFFLPFILLFFTKNLFSITEGEYDKKKKKIIDPGFLKQLTLVFTQGKFWLLVTVTFIITTAFYGWMFYRAQEAYPFMFGKPDTFDELFYHISGGSYAKNITGTSGEVIRSRIPYFLNLTAMQLFVFLPLLIAGVILFIRKKLFKLLFLVLTYFLILFIYQVNNDQWSSTDAYMLLPFLVLNIPVFMFLMQYKEKIKAQFILPVLVLIQIIYNFPLHNKKTYPVSESLMQLLDKSAPPNCIILIADWTTTIQYYYYRIVENFRPDLVVLHYDLKFTHYKILPELYPEFYQKVAKEYDHFIKELIKEHPHQATNTGCDLSTPALSEAYKRLLLKIESEAHERGAALLTDPKAHYFYSTENYYNPARYVSGGYSSSRVGTNEANDFFLKLDLPYLKSPLHLKDPAAMDKLVDFQAMLDRHKDFYAVNKDMRRYELAEQTHGRVMRMQREMKRNMSFAYKVK